MSYMPRAVLAPYELSYRQAQGYLGKELKALVPAKAGSERLM